MICKALIFLVVSMFLSFLTVDTVLGQSSSSQENSASGDSPKIENSRPLPGEEITTSSGKKMKVWSTEGPVPVSQAPQPFEDREKTVIPNMGVVIDADIKGANSPTKPNHRK